MPIHLLMHVVAKGGPIAVVGAVIGAIILPVIGLSGWETGAWVGGIIGLAGALGAYWLGWIELDE